MDGFIISIFVLCIFILLLLLEIYRNILRLGYQNNRTSPPPPDVLSYNQSFLSDQIDEKLKNISRKKI